MANPLPDTGENELYEQIIDALSTIFGSHRGYRPVHAKGIMCEGTFQATPAARELTRAEHMQGERVPTKIRFSDFSGVPSVRDGDATASPRGMAIRFELSDGVSTDIVAQSYDGFPARDAAEFLAFLRALASSGPGTPKPTPLETFVSNHPAAKLFIEAPKPAPESFATESYYSVDAFRFINRNGRGQFGRYQVVPVAGERHLESSQAAALPGDYLFHELNERLRHHPAEFRLVVQMAAEGDPIQDPTQPWPEDRRQIELGTLSITKPLPDSGSVQRSVGFDPARLPDGIEPGDPLIEVRSAIYAIAVRRR